MLAAHPHTTLPGSHTLLPAHTPAHHLSSGCPCQGPTSAASLTVYPTPLALPRQVRVHAVALPGTPSPNLARWPLPLVLSTLRISLPAPLERPSKAGQDAPCAHGSKTVSTALTTTCMYMFNQPPHPFPTTQGNRRELHEDRTTLCSCSVTTGRTNEQMTRGKDKRGKLQRLPGLTRKEDSFFLGHAYLGPPSCHL